MGLAGDSRPDGFAGRTSEISKIGASAKAEEPLNLLHSRGKASGSHGSLASSSASP